MKPLPYLLAAMAIGCGACGAEEPTAIQRVSHFLVAMEAKDDRRACAMMTPKLQRAITINLRIDSVGGTCRTRAADVYSPAKAPGNRGARVTSVHVVRGRATAIVTARSSGAVAAGPVESQIHLEKHGNRWQIADF